MKTTYIVPVESGFRKLAGILVNQNVLLDRYLTGCKDAGGIDNYEISDVSHADQELRRGEREVTIYSAMELKPAIVAALEKTYRGRAITL